MEKKLLLLILIWLLIALAQGCIAPDVVQVERVVLELIKVETFYKKGEPYAGHTWTDHRGAEYYEEVPIADKLFVGAKTFLLLRR